MLDFYKPTLKLPHVGAEKCSSALRVFADDTVVCSEGKEQVEDGWKRWRYPLERGGTKVTRNKTLGILGLDMCRGGRVDVLGKVKCQRWSSAKREKKRATAEKVHGCGTWRRMVGVTRGEAKRQQLKEKEVVKKKKRQTKVTHCGEKKKALDVL